MEEASLLLPSLSDQDKAFFCYANIIALLQTGGDPESKIIAAALSIAAQYGLIVTNEWQRVDSKLHQAKYHFEMEEHYRLTGKYLQDKLNIR